MVTDEIRFTDAHQWMRRIEQGLFIAGITDFAVEILERQIVAVDLSKPGEICARNSPYGVLEGARGTFDLVAPVSGTISCINQRVLGDPDLISRDPYGNGWLIQISPSDPLDYESLLSASQYADL